MGLGKLSKAWDRIEVGGLGGRHCVKVGDAGLCGTSSIAKCQSTVRSHLTILNTIDPCY